MSVKQVSGSEVDERLAALLTNANAVRAIASAVEGTIGSKGLDTMLVDRFGEVVITNDGITILTKMEVNHPAARMVVNVARAQEEEVGDGTTTATIMAGALLGEAVNQVIKGVPVTRVIEGVRLGIRSAVEEIQSESQRVGGVDDPALLRVAMIAGREHQDIAELVVASAKMFGPDKFKDPAFKLADSIIAEEGADNEVFSGVIIGKQRMDRQMPQRIRNVRVLVFDDALEPEKVPEEALKTDYGIRKQDQFDADFETNLNKVLDLKVNLILVDRGVDDRAVQLFSEAGVMVLQRVSNRELRQAAEHTGARVIKRIALRKPAEELKNLVGKAKLAYEDEKLEHVRIIGGAGKPMATVLVGAATEEVVGERERIAQDAAAAVQAAVRGGVVPGGGAVEIAASRALLRRRNEARGMAAYGVDCVVEALKKPLSQIVANAGFNPLEKVGDAIAAQSSVDKGSLAIDTDTGEVADMLELGVLDPTLVKTHALRAAGEIAEAILRIDTIIKKRDEGGTGQGPSPESPDDSDLDF